jgi:hypothetical protein
MGRVDFEQVRSEQFDLLEEIGSDQSGQFIY